MPRFRWRIRGTTATLPEKMNVDRIPSLRLAPLQRVMLRDSLADGTAGHHIEQLEIVFAPGGWRNRVAGSWAETVFRTEALRIAFRVENGVPVGFETAIPPITPRLEETPPASWDAWLAADRCRPLLMAHEVPWRATYWPTTGRFLWTFHHALLDGRSIITVLRSFLASLSGSPAEDLALSEWHPPSAGAVALAGRMFLEDFRQPQPEIILAHETAETPALRIAGADFRERLESAAVAMEVTTATVLIWAWGQALAEASDTGSVIVEQIRAGTPQTGSAGFTMNILPVRIPRAEGGGPGAPLRDFRNHLLALREIEGVSPEDFPPGVFPDVDRAGGSVIMVERATPQYLLGSKMAESLVLHEPRGESLMATAHILPDLRLEVEGPGRHGLLNGWLRVLENLAGLP